MYTPKGIKETEAATLSSLTKQERIIFQRVVAGQRSKQIADELFISKHTVDTHRRNIIRKLELKGFMDWLRVGLQA